VRVTQSWLAEYVEIGDASAEEIGEAFVKVGLEIEEIHPAPDVTGPVVVGQVLEIEELTEFKKPIRWCEVDIGKSDPQGVICGATNFAVGDLVVVTLPGTVLPGGFEVGARKTYGRVSNGMIASVRELGIGAEHAGILVLPPGTATPGTPAADVLGLAEPVIELNVTPDRGYCFAVRGLARELAASTDADYTDPVVRVPVPDADGDAWPITLDDASCSRFVARGVDGVDPSAPTPWWMQRRLLAAGMRPISLIVDVTNYVMLELGQPLHAFDRRRVTGGIVVRRATAGEKLTTLDDVVRSLDPDDLVVTDETGPISLAGVMGGASTEIPVGGTEPVDVLLEAATWEPALIARMARRHKLPSEASKRFERTVDPMLPPVAAERAAQLLVEFGGGTIVDGRTDVGAVVAPAPVQMALDLPDRVAGVTYPRGATVRRLTQIGCSVELITGDDGRGQVVATPPTWRADLSRPADLVEEVLRLEGLDLIPSILPAAAPGRGLTPAQLRKRAVARALAENGYVEVLPFPFIDPTVWAAFGLDPGDPRRRTVHVVNPLDAERAELATTLLPGLLDTLGRNRSRGLIDLALYTIGQVTQPHHETVPMPDPPVDARPGDDVYAQINAALPQQPIHVGVVLAGDRDARGWWGPGRAAEWSDAVAAALLVGKAAGVELRPVAATLAPFHPGRCAEIRLGDWPIGHAGELHPKVVEALELPPRTCAMEVDLDLIPLDESRPVPVVSPYPPITVDVALVVDAAVPAAALAEALEDGGGALLDQVRLFDVYVGEQVGEGKRSLAYTLRFRAPDRTLTSEEANAARDAAVAVAVERHGAALRG